MTNSRNNRLLGELVDSLDLPDSAYEKAISRYEDIGEWLSREDSSCAINEPHIFPQGSFRLGIAVRPISGEEEYDLDLACNLRSGITSGTHSQKQLKNLVGVELELYRKARQIKSDLEEKHRCWRLEYADSLKFHLDIVPCIPEDETKKKYIANNMRSSGMQENLANKVSELAVGITDDRHPKYKEYHSSWMISNPEGYAQWFEHRMRPTVTFKAACESAQIDEVPTYRQKTPLQRTIQILKRHRDQMFSQRPDSKPISVIITTLAARNYTGSSSIEDTINEVLVGLVKFVESDSSVVLNPVNPEENFADRWQMDKYKHLGLKQSFHNWVGQLTKDINLVLGSDDLELICESISNSLSVKKDLDNLSSILGLQRKTKITPSSLLRPATIASAVTTSSVSFANKPRVPKKPDGFA